LTSINNNLAGIFEKSAEISEVLVASRSDEGLKDSPGEWTWDEELDARGLFCPEPVMLLHNRVADVQPGQILRVVATDPSTTRDIPRFCQFLNHDLLESREQDGEFLFFIRRGE
jgi:tRNA 2-thiouridine synthesizing protein A